MWAASPDSNGGLDEETLDALREALSIAFQNRGTAVNQRDRIRSNGGRRGRNPGAETGPGTRTNPIDLTATTSSSSSPGSRVFRSLGASGRRDGRDGRDGRENDRFRCSGRASRSATGSGFRSADTGMNRSSESGSFKEFLDSNGEASENLRSDEQEDSESTSSESPFTAGIQYSTAAMYTNEEESSLETRDGQEEFISTNGNLPGALCSYQGESLRTRNGQDERATGVGSSLAGTLSNGEESVRTPDEGILVNVDSLAAMWSDGEEGFELADEVAETILRKHSPAVIETNKESLGIPCDGEAGVLVHGNTPAAKWSAGEQSLEAPDDQVENILTTGHLTEARGVNEEGVLEISEDEDLQRGELGWLNGRSMDSEDACSLGSDMEPDFLREDPEHHSQANHRTRPSRLPASQAMRPLMSVVIPVRVSASPSTLNHYNCQILLT